MKILALLIYMYSFSLVLSMALIGLTLNNPNPEKVTNYLLFAGSINIISFCYLVSSKFNIKEYQQ